MNRNSWNVDYYFLSKRLRFTAKRVSKESKKIDSTCLLPVKSIFIEKFVIQIRELCGCVRKATYMKSNIYC